VVGLAVYLSNKYTKSKRTLLGKNLARLVLSVNTVKRHVYNLCGKLGVQSRAQVIVRARDLNLV
jgi:Bacterial regulatory proteins, luxR family